MDQLQAEKATTLHAQIIFHIKEKMHEWGSPRVQREMENNELRSQWWGAESRPHRGTFSAPSAKALARSSPQDSWKVIHQQIVPLDAPQLLNWRIFGDQHSSLTLKCWMWGGQMICYFTGFWIKNNGIKGSPLNLIADFVVLDSEVVQWDIQWDIWIMSHITQWDFWGSWEEMNVFCTGRKVKYLGLREDLQILFKYSSLFFRALHMHALWSSSLTMDLSLSTWLILANSKKSTPLVINRCLKSSCLVRLTLSWCSLTFYISTLWRGLG